ncbi:DegT/DnrJ/EryC1/StrS family aminotransferase [Micromonospora sp. NPDC047134]|uniref:DegT/DnrJ/EryC1/StrS family aminotransferase n=1 Tax=Micromonospora sp. NPDC047134 TaxID=3154340 RepID=UPI0033EB2882
MITQKTALPAVDRLEPDELPVWPQYDDTERHALIRALEQGQWWRVGGREVEEFESEFAAFNGAPYAVAVTNGTAAIELALRVHGIGPGDEVIVPAFTFVSTSLAVQNLGAVPVPADVDGGHGCLTVEACRAAITPRTRAIMPVHMAGHVADLAGLAALADEHGCVLIQDAAHSQGASRDGVLVGAAPSVACYSFQNGKLMTAGEGGAVTLPDEETYERAYLLHTCGRPRADVTYQHVTGGTNARMNEFSAAVLRAQLARLPRQTAIRKERAALLDGLLAEVPGLRTQQRDPRVDVHTQYMYLLRLEADRYTTEDRNRLVDELKARGVPACVNFPPVYRTKSFRAGPAPQTSTEELAERCAESELFGDLGLWLHHRTLLAEPTVVERLAGTVVSALTAVERSR